MRLLLVATLAITIVFPATQAWAQNLVMNPDFDTDVSGWITESTATIDWNPLDADNDPSSGSALVTNVSDTPGDSTGAHQCIEGVTGEAFYHFSSDILLPGGHSETGYAGLFVQWNDEPGCSGYLGSEFSSDVSTATPDVWYRVTNIAQAPMGTESARLRLSVRKFEDFGTLEAHFDNVEFEELIFVNGFESGDTSAWSGVGP
jgi:hypothetical protein